MVSVQDTATTCSQSQIGTAVVSINALPTATIAGTTAICSGTGTNITFSGTPNATVAYTINGGANQSIILDGSGTATVATGNLTVNTTYALVSVINGCTVSLTQSVLITVNPLSAMVLTSAVNTDNQTICANTPLIPTTYSVGAGVTGASVVSGALPVGVTGVFVPSTGIFTISGTPTLAGTYPYTVSTSGGCAPDIQLSGTITVTTSSTVVLTSVIATANQNKCINSAIDTIIYTIGGSATGLIASGLPAGVSLSAATGNDYTISGTSTVAGTYNYTVTTTGGCVPGAILSGVIKVVPLPDPLPVATPAYICVDVNGNFMGSSTIQTQLDDTNYTYEWSDANGVIAGETLSYLIVNVPGTYSVVAIPNDNQLCRSAPKSVAIVPSLPPSGIVATPSDYFAEVQTITVTVTPTGNYEYQIDNGGFQSSNIFTNVGAGLHTITVVDVNHCGQATTTAYIVDYPRFFTPNGDGYHDTWNISELSAQPNAKIYIFDRFGKFLKEIRPSGAGWSGIYNAKDLPATDYWFVVTYEEKGITKELKSHFALKR